MSDIRGFVVSGSGPARFGRPVQAGAGLRPKGPGGILRWLDWDGLLDC